MFQAKTERYQIKAHLVDGLFNEKMLAIQMSTNLDYVTKIIRINELSGLLSGIAYMKRYICATANNIDLVKFYKNAYFDVKKNHKKTYVYENAHTKQQRTLTVVSTSNEDVYDIGLLKEDIDFKKLKAAINGYFYSSAHKRRAKRCAH